MEENLRIAPGRANHAIGGLSMGGYGSLIATAQLPTYFGNALSFSGLLDNQDFTFAPILALAQCRPRRLLGRVGSPGSAYATTSMNPLKTPASTPSRASTSGTAPPGLDPVEPRHPRPREATLEVGTNLQAGKFLSALKDTREGQHRQPPQLLPHWTTGSASSPTLPARPLGRPARHADEVAASSGTTAR